MNSNITYHYLDYAIHIVCLFFISRKEFYLEKKLCSERSSEKWLLLLWVFCKIEQIRCLLSLLLMPSACHPITNRSTGCLRRGASPANSAATASLSFSDTLDSKQPRCHHLQLPNPPKSSPPPSFGWLSRSCVCLALHALLVLFPQHNYNYHTSLFFFLMFLEPSPHPLPHAQFPQVSAPGFLSRCSWL